MSKPDRRLLTQIALRGLELAPSQGWGGVRLVPILRRQVRDDLRLARRAYDEDLTLVAVSGKSRSPGTSYLSYVPHGLVVTWSDDGTAAAAYGTHVIRPDGGVIDAGSDFAVRVLHRMARREDPHRLRMLPLHLAMEGFLALHFQGPSIAWREYSQQALRQGLSPRSEHTISGWGIPGLADALRVFELHDDQVGMLVFVADALASAFVVSHPDDYRALHRTLLEDFYGELLLHYGNLPATGHLSTMAMDERRVATLADLRRELGVMRHDWQHYLGYLAEGLLGRDVAATAVYRAGPFLLQRFMTDLAPNQENHFGEALVRDDGTLEYLKTYRLSAAQTRRAYLLRQLAAHHWNLDATAAALHLPLDELIVRLENAGFAYLLHPDILRASRLRRARTGSNR